MTTASVAAPSAMSTAAMMSPVGFSGSFVGDCGDPSSLLAGGASVSAASQVATQASAEFQFTVISFVDHDWMSST